MADTVDSTTALEASLGKTPAAVHQKVIDHLDEHALHWLTHSPLAFVAFGGGDAIGIALGGGEPGFARALDAWRLLLPAALLDEPALARVGAGCGALFLLPAVGETLRVNGRVTAVGDTIELAVEECYLHCAKALIRSAFWTAPPRDFAGGTADLLDASRFMALATIDAEGHADVSRQGRPALAAVRKWRYIPAQRGRAGGRCWRRWGRRPPSSDSSARSGGSITRW